MRRCKLNNSHLVCLCEAIQCNNKRFHTLHHCCLEGSLQIPRFAHIKKVGLKPERLRRPLRFRPLRLKNWIAHVEEPRDPSQARYQFSEYLDSLSVGLNIERAKARDIPSWACEAEDDAGSNGITASRHDYWNSSGSRLGGQGGRCSSG